MSEIVPHVVMLRTVVVLPNILVLRTVVMLPNVLMVWAARRWR